MALASTPMYGGSMAKGGGAMPRVLSPMPSADGESDSSSSGSDSDNDSDSSEENFYRDYRQDLRSSLLVAQHASRLQSVTNDMDRYMRYMTRDLGIDETDPDFADFVFHLHDLSLANIFVDPMCHSRIVRLVLLHLLTSCITVTDPLIFFSLSQRYQKNLLPQQLTTSSPK